MGGAGFEDEAGALVDVDTLVDEVGTLVDDDVDTLFDGDGATLDTGVPGAASVVKISIN